VDKTNPKGRVLMLDEVKWEDGWPYVTSQSPSREWMKPSF
jgi:arabinan endo-1,5-alpha-L-arabinosidase